MDSTLTIYLKMDPLAPVFSLEPIALTRVPFRTLIYDYWGPDHE